MKQEPEPPSIIYSCFIFICMIILFPGFMVREGITRSRNKRRSNVTAFQSLFIVVMSGLFWFPYVYWIYKGIIFILLII